MKSRWSNRSFIAWRTAMLLCVCSISTPASAAGMRLGDLVRVRGQETNTLQGWGLVVGLQGTGDSDSAVTSGMLARMVQLMGGPITSDHTGKLNLEDVEGAKNVASVYITAEIPAVGAQQGDLVDVTVSAISAKSLEGGRLISSPLFGPRTDDKTPYALAQGDLSVSLDGATTRASIEGGAKMEQTIKASFHDQGKLTLVLDSDFADFNTAHTIAEEINRFIAFTLGDPTLNFRRNASVNSPAPNTSFSQQSSVATTARAIDQKHVEVQIPPEYSDSPIRFLSLLLDIDIPMTSRSHRVVINESEGIVLIGEDVEIAPALITHRNLRIEAGGSGLANLATGDDPETNAKLKDLSNALNALDVPADDLIAIIKQLKAKGDLYGEVIFR